MKRKNLEFENGFRVALGNSDSQAAEMVLPRATPKEAPKTGTWGPINGCMLFPERAWREDREWRMLSPRGRLPHTYRTWGQA